MEHEMITIRELANRHDLSVFGLLFAANKLFPRKMGYHSDFTLATFSEDGDASPADRVLAAARAAGSESRPAPKARKMITPKPSPPRAPAATVSPSAPATTKGQPMTIPITPEQASAIAELNAQKLARAAVKIRLAAAQAGGEALNRQELDTLCDSEWRESPALRAEFLGDFDMYGAFRRAELRGGAKVYGGRRASAAA